MVLHTLGSALCLPIINIPPRSKAYANGLPTTCLKLSTENGLRRLSFRLRTNASKYQQCSPVCLFGDKGKAKDANDASPWKSIENAIGSFKKDTSVEDLLRKQIEKQEYYDGGGSGGIPPSGGGGGGDGSGELEGEGSNDDVMDEFVQVILATTGFIFLYIYIINGEDLLRLAKDYIKYLLGGTASLRLRNAMHEWAEISRSMNRKKVEDEYWLERAIINTETWYDSPEKYRRLLKELKDYIDSTPDDDDE